MEICLHLGAHRCASTSFQHFMQVNRAALKADGTLFWGPGRIRNGFFEGLIRDPRHITDDSRRLAQRSRGRIRIELQRTAEAGAARLVVSEENMIGTMSQNLAAHRLYGQAHARLSRIAPAFGGRPLRVALAVRSYDSYWASSIAFRVRAGMALPDADVLDRLTTQPRRWRDLIGDVARVFPEAEIAVWPFEAWAGQADAQLAMITGRLAPKRLVAGAERHNSRPGGRELAEICGARGEAAPCAADARYMPFDAAQRRKMQADYAADINWLRAGADGRASYFEPFTKPAEDTLGGRQDQTSQNVRGRPDYVRRRPRDETGRLAQAR